MLVKFSIDSINKSNDKIMILLSALKKRHRVFIIIGIAIAAVVIIRTSILYFFFQ